MKNDCWVFYVQLHLKNIVKTVIQENQRSLSLESHPIPTETSSHPTINIDHRRGPLLVQRSHSLLPLFSSTLFAHVKGWKIVIGCQDVQFLLSWANSYSAYPKNVVEVKAWGPPHVLKLRLEANRGMLLVKYFCSDISTCLCQSNFMEIMSHGWGESVHHQFWGYYQILNNSVCLSTL